MRNEGEKDQKQLKKGKNNPEKSEKRVQKTQKVTINYFSRGEFREKRMNMMDIYAMIRDGKYQKRVGQLREDYMDMLSFAQRPIRLRRWKTRRVRDVIWW